MSAGDGVNSDGFGGAAGGPERPELTDALAAFKSAGGAAGAGGGPDLTARILSRVEQRRGFRTRRGRVLAGVWRASAVVVMAGLVSAIVVLQSRPEFVSLSPLADRPRPVTELVQRASDEAARRVAGVESVLAGGGRVPGSAGAAGAAAELASWQKPASRGARGAASGGGVVLTGFAAEPRAGIVPVGSFADELAQSMTGQAALGPK